MHQSLANHTQLTPLAAPDCCNLYTKCVANGANTQKQPRARSFSLTTHAARSQPARQQASRPSKQPASPQKPLPLQLANVLALTVPSHFLSCSSPFPHIKKLPNKRSLREGNRKKSTSAGQLITLHNRLLTPPRKSSCTCTTRRAAVSSLARGTVALFTELDETNKKGPRQSTPRSGGSIVQ